MALPLRRKFIVFQEQSRAAQRSKAAWDGRRTTPEKKTGMIFFRTRDLGARGDSLNVCCKETINYQGILFIDLELLQQSYSATQGRTGCFDMIHLSYIHKTANYLHSQFQFVLLLLPFIYCDLIHLLQRWRPLNLSEIATTRFLTLLLALSPSPRTTNTYSGKTSLASLGLHFPTLFSTTYQSFPRHLLLFAS